MENTNSNYQYLPDNHYAPYNPSAPHKIHPNNVHNQVLPPMSIGVNQQHNSVGKSEILNSYDSPKFVHYHNFPFYTVKSNP